MLRSGWNMGVGVPQRRGFGVELCHSQEKVYNLYKTFNKIAKINVTVRNSVHNWNAEMASAVCCRTRDRNIRLSCQFELALNRLDLKL